MQDNIPSHTPFNPREISMPAQKNSYLSNSHISKPKFHPTKSEPENRAQQKKQTKHPQQSSIQKINKASQKKHRNKKLDIKKLIQQKQARENLHKSEQQKEGIRTNKVYKLFESTDHPSIDRCLICGYIVFNSNISQRARLKLEHAKKEHCQYPFIDKKSVETEINNDQYTKMAGELVYFANDRNNRELMEYVLGQYIPQPFKAYVEPMPVKTQWKKWAKVVQDVFKIHS